MFEPTSSITPTPEPARQNGGALRAEIIVVGAGIIGVTAALELQAAGHDVLLIDRKGMGEECSFGNAGHIAVEHIFPLSNPDILKRVPGMFLTPNGPLSLRLSYLPRLMPWLMRFLWAARPAQVARGLEGLSALNSQAMNAYDSLEARFGLGGLFHKDGTLVVYDDANNLAMGADENALLAGHGIRTETFGAQKLKTFDAALNPALKGAVYFPDSAHISDPYALVQTLAAHFVRLGGRFEKRKVTRLDVTDKQVTVSTSFGSATGHKLVVAAGAWSHQLLAEIGYKTPLETERGYHLMASGPSISPRVPTTYYEKRFVATPMDGGLRVAGRVELGGLKLPMRDAQASALAPLAQDLLPGLTTTGAIGWMGFRPTLPDSLPVIGAAPGHTNVICAFGHHHLGLTQAPITARLVLDLVKGQSPELDLTPYRLDRF